MLRRASSERGHSCSEIVVQAFELLAAGLRGLVQAFELLVAGFRGVVQAFELLAAALES